MKLLYFMVLLSFGNTVENSGRQCDKKTDIFLYSSKNLSISENLTTLQCTLENSECYVQCSFVKLGTNISANNTINVVENHSENYSLVLNISDQEISCNVIKCEQDGIIKLISESLSSSDMKILRRPTHIKNMCAALFASNSIIKKNYIRAEKRYIDALINLAFNETTKNYNREEFNMTVVKMNMMNTTDLWHVQISAPKVPDDVLPLEVFIPSEPFMNVSEEQVKVGIVNYPSAQIFKNDLNTVLMSQVIRVETVGHKIKHLSKRLVIEFSVNTGIMISEPWNLSCQFYNVDAIAGQEWNDMGSFTKVENFNSSNNVTCSYDHMTPFAVLLVDMKMTQIDSQHWKILSYLTYIGCSLSSFFSIVTIFLYMFMRSSSRDNSIRIHVSLSVASFLLNTSFLFIEWGATWSQEGACVLIAVILQYSLLSCFSWMANEAIHLYLLLIKVFNTYIKHYMVKLSLFGWGVPAVLVGGSLCVFGSKPFYGTTQIQLSDTKETTKFCWITDPHFLYGMNITYFCLIFLFNTCILVIVTYQIFKLRCLNIKGKTLPSHTDTCTVLGLTFLLGMTWGLAFFSSGYTNYPILYLFCIFNSLQGLFLFLWFYGTMKKNRSLEAKTSTVSEPASSTQ
ncbi:adhesion G-protein coupled receptor G5-like [Neoarius graeffei]|uniref:adhesion G-protein coupled receptor G5-like n=1 Tax=Neoarius graeffei TaxID=443677 RepID=UPI00298C3F20|nr:adhesion G-protein coupled receptor G5-like [Neoarius graeffei]